MGYCHSYAMEPLVVQKKCWGELMKAAPKVSWKKLETTPSMVSKFGNH